MSGPPYILAEGITHVYRSPREADLTAVDAVSLSVAAGEFVSVIGPSGCGKTTMLRAIGGLLTPTAGNVLIGGRSPQVAQRRKSIGFVAQDPSLLPWRTVRQNILLPLQVNPGAGPGQSQDAAERLIDAVGLSEFRDYYPHQLSGGMKQRVALARALVFDPEALLMDEPLGALDELTRSAMRYEVLRVWESSRKAALMVTHSIAEAVMMSDRVIVMSTRPGRIVDDVAINLPRPRHDSLEGSSQFLSLVKRVKDNLSTGVRRA